MASVKEMLHIEESRIFNCSNKILEVCKNFDKLYPKLENLRKFNSLSFDESDKKLEKS